MKVHDHSKTNNRGSVSSGAKRRPNGSPKKSLGQHFLKDSSIGARIVEAARIEPGETVLEVGPGRGAITGMLADKADSLVLIELDTALAMMLSERYESSDVVRVIEADARDLDLNEGGDIPEVVGRPYKVVANLPYYAAANIIRRFLEADNPPTQIVVMIQREVAQEMAAPEGKMGLLSIATRFYADAEVLFDVPGAAFIPPPKVTSSIIRLVRRPDKPLDLDDEAEFFRFVKSGFKAPRKQLHNSLSRGLIIDVGEAMEIIERAELDSMRRPRTLTIAEWGRLYEAHLAVSSAEEND
ncbi:MAG: ribosomal RNA small subunit methyltransferase A [Chloroflexi bacterium]|jgi:16S rRNA (adenine1518-N6/adenine1519-N6)-dimethyltransferase|nr:ribosomal RNA small subunit methyltransferase A [Chloroflexota bacterium]MBT4072205.1 ribosomal RNA small subunit methyltransferase A [Chloroflexota bacterium]MBT6680841.1 ribosomal RNA small subunit methyltransferase A [Chloroflexota bacterium]